MSQSDYIQRKKTLTKLSGISKTPIDIGDFPQVFSSQDYTDFSQYQLSNTIINTKTTPNELVAPNHKIIFDMEVLNSTDCPSFTKCYNTNNRPNRKLNTGFIRQNGMPNTRPVAKYSKKDSTLAKYVNNHSCYRLMLLRTPESPIFMP